MNSRIKTKIKHYINRLPYIRILIEELEICKKEHEVCKKELENTMSHLRTHKKKLEVYEVAFPPGHYYSPIVSKKEVMERDKEIFSRNSKEILGISLNEENQLELLEELYKFYPDVPFRAERQANLRYFYDNEFFADIIADICNLKRAKFYANSAL